MESIKEIKPKYPAELSIGILLLVFIIAVFLSHQIFRVTFRDPNTDVYMGMILVGIAVVVMVVIMWEEILFPTRVKVVRGGMVFRNHSTKLKVQIFIYFLIPAIFAFIYTRYEVNQLRFIVWTAVCVLLPVVGKLASGLNNYNDFLKLTGESVEYKNNKKEGSFMTKDIQHISVVKEKGKTIPKLQLLFTDNNTVTIDLDEMELDAFYDYIFKFISIRYKHLL